LETDDCSANAESIQDRQEWEQSWLHAWGFTRVDHQGPTGQDRGSRDSDGGFFAFDAIHVSQQQRIDSDDFPVWIPRFE
jgi:hypothetical protein